MGWGYGVVDGRHVGYMVMATCDKLGCNTEIDRGLGYVCGDFPHNLWSDEPGCGRFYCEKHLSRIGSRGGCLHRRAFKAWGQILSCMTLNSDETIICLNRKSHPGPHFEVKKNALGS